MTTFLHLLYLIGLAALIIGGAVAALLALWLFLQWAIPTKGAAVTLALMAIAAAAAFSTNE